LIRIVAAGLATQGVAGWHVQRRRVEDRSVVAVGQRIYLAATGIEEPQAVAAIGQTIADLAIADSHQHSLEVGEVLAEIRLIANHHGQAVRRQHQGWQEVSTAIVPYLPVRQIDGPGSGIEQFQPLVARVNPQLDGVVLHFVDEDITRANGASLRRGRRSADALRLGIPKKVAQVIRPRSRLDEEDVIGIQYLAAAGGTGAHGDVVGRVALDHQVVGKLPIRDQAIPAVLTRGVGAQVMALSVQLIVAIEVELSVSQRPAGVPHLALVDGAPEAPD